MSYEPPMEDLPRILKEAEKFKSVDERINFLLLQKRDAEISILKFSTNHRIGLGGRVHPNLVNLPKSLESEINRLIILRSLKLKDDSENENEKVENSKYEKTNIQEVHNEIFNVEEAASYLKVSKSHIYKLTYQNLIPYSKPSGKKIFIVKKDLDDFIKMSKTKTKYQIDIEANTYFTKQLKK